MAVKTKIQWTDGTVNPTTGCEGCELWNGRIQKCYAGVITKRFGRSNRGLADDFNIVNLAPGRMEVAAQCKSLTGTKRLSKPWLNGLPRLWFIGDMADTFSKDVPFEYLRDEVILRVASPDGLRHQWQWLTKRPVRMAAFSAWLQEQSISWPSNLWVGTSVTTQGRTNRIAALLRVGDDHTLRFVSIEPQWGAIDLKQWLPHLDWVIQGGHSGSHDHPFAIEWADDLREQCAKSHVPYFLKQLGSCITVNGNKLRGHRGQGGDCSKWPARLRVRQMPVCVGQHRTKAIRQRGLGYVPS